jgi:chemotaxis protein MotB
VARKKHAEEHENHERWLVSYADFITLLFAFFVVMYSVSRVDNKKLQQAATSVKWALHMSGAGGTNKLPIFNEPDGSGLDMGGGSKNNSVQRPSMEQLRQRLERHLGRVLVERHARVTIEVEGQRLAIRLSATHFFDTGQSALRPEALPIIDAIVAELKPLERPIRVEGHTDKNLPLGGRFKSNWELSAARAATVVAYLESAHEIRPELLSAVGHGATNPIAPEDTAEGRELNRRVELVVELGVGQELSVAAR